MANLIEQVDILETIDEDETYQPDVDVSIEEIKFLPTEKKSLYANNLYLKSLFDSTGFVIPGGAGATFGGGNSTTYFIEKGSIFTEINARIKKKHLKLFNDCPILIEKIKNERIKNIKRIVILYNNDCHEN